MNDVDLDTPRYRSSAAARLANMPVTTLRMWERRHAVVGPRKSPAGQRLYSAREVQRLGLLKQLVEHGHAIGAIARLDQDRLERLAQAPLPTRPVLPQAGVDGNPRLLVVGTALYQRLAISGARLGDAGHVGDLDAARRLPGEDRYDALLIYAPSLQADTADQVLALADRCGASAVGVIYAFGNASALDTLRVAGARLYRETLNSLEPPRILREVLEQSAAGHADGAGWGRAPRRYGDEQLAAIARRSSTIACECPRHVSELILQLSAFEQYSDGCASRTPADAVLHRYLGDVASRARALFEKGLERIAREEGWDPAAPALAAPSTTERA